MTEHRTQKERIDEGRKKFNDTILKESISDNIYEAILEWKVFYKVDLYVEGKYQQKYQQKEFIKEVQDSLSKQGYESIADKIQIVFHYSNRGTCICGQNNLRYVYYIENINTFKILNVGSDCVYKVFPDGTVKDEISIINSSIKKCVKEHDPERKFKKQISLLKNRIMELSQENRFLLEERDKFVKDKTLKIQTKLDNISKENIKLKNEVEQWHYCYNFYLKPVRSEEDDFFRACDKVS